MVKSFFAGISPGIIYCSCNTRPWACLFSLTRKKVDRSSINNSASPVNVAHLSIVNFWLEGLNTCTVVNTSIYCKCDVLVLCRIVVLSYTSSCWRLLGTYDFLDVLRMFFSLNQIKLLQTFMELINIRNWLANNCLPIVFAELVSEILFLGRMEKGAYLWFITSQFVAADSFVLVWVVKSFDCCVTFWALQALRTLVPTDALLENFTIFGGVFKNFGRPSKISHVVSVDAAFAIMRVLFVWTPSWFVHEHVENKSVLVQVQVLEVVV
jgi:hypothetical protein